MIHARLRPLLVLLVLLAAGLVARLFQVQVLEHELWAREASRLVLSGCELPYRRGRILDANGTVLARDEELRTVVLVYRRFRREHPLGQVAHARSLLEGRPVALGDARTHLAQWARELVALGPADLRAFARGERGSADADMDPQLRRRRAADLLFYLQGLLGLGGKEQAQAWKAVLALAAEEDGPRSFLELAAAVRRDPEHGLEQELQALEQRLTHALERLAVLARWLQPALASDGAVSTDPLARLAAELEEARRSIEDATATRLFAEAAGFDPGRVETDTLLECFDHGWIAALLGWDAERLAEWAARAREEWQREWRDQQLLPRLFWELVSDPAAEPGPADFLDRLAAAYLPEEALAATLAEGPRPWREVEELAVFAELESAVEAGVPESVLALGRSALPILLEDLRADPDPARLLPAGTGQGSFRALLEKALTGRHRADVETLLALAAQMNVLWDLRFQETLRRVLEEVVRAAGRGERGPGGGLLLARGNRERAAERAEYFLKDFGSRARPLGGEELSYDVVYLLTRYEADFPGFQVRELAARERVRLELDDEHPAHALIGQVSAPTLEDLLRQRREAARLRKLKSDPEHGAEELEELRRLIGEVRLPHEARGVSGIEALYERELAGTNGFAQTRGLAELFGPGGDELAVREPVDGEDVLLTLDAGLQAAAQRSLRVPIVPDDPKRDDAWLRDPVGAVVLLGLDGDVLAAASEPDDQSLVPPEAAGQRLFPSERTLRKPTFQPPGSVFKVFVAAWALDHGLDSARTATCGPLEDGRAGYVDLHCWNTHGHGPLDLRSALVHSCNGYFAWLGETLRTAQFQKLCAAFGFGQATGVREPPSWDDGLLRRAGLAEDLAGLAVPPDGGELSASLRRMAANGLGRIEATPMQLARATLALATGEKRELRLVKRVGERELPHGARESLPISARSLDFVRDAMRAVAAEPGGTAHAALAPGGLGFPVCVKTGSADIQGRDKRDEEGGVRKHAWVAGWAPAEDPRLVFVVFEHSTSATSSHGAIYLARQVLQQPEVLNWLAGAGVDVSGVAAR